MSTSVLDRVSTVRAVFAVAFVVIVGAMFSVADEPITPLLAVAMVLAFGLVIAGAFDAVREHDLFTLVSTLIMTVLFGVWWATVEDGAILPGVLVVLGVLGVAVEAYNYVHGTTYLRIES